MSRRERTPISLYFSDGFGQVSRCRRRFFIGYKKKKAPEINCLIKELV